MVDFFRTVPPRRFPLGRVVITPNAQLALDRVGLSIDAVIDRHARGDWGRVDATDRAANDRATASPDGMILSCYELPSATGDATVELWVITDPGREVTTVLTPDEY
jgi:hypothetical protein